MKITTRSHAMKMLKFAYIHRLNLEITEFDATKYPGVSKDYVGKEVVTNSWVACVYPAAGKGKNGKFVKLFCLSSKV